jgi:hypothetical protein
MNTLTSNNLIELNNVLENQANSTEPVKSSKNNNNNIVYTKNLNGVMVRKYEDQMLDSEPVFSKFFFKNSHQKTKCNVSTFNLNTSISDPEEFSRFVTFNNNHTINLDDMVCGLVEVRTFFHKKGDESHPVTCVCYKLENDNNIQKLYLNNVDTNMFNTLLYVLNDQ